jgi:hypothetical protein
LAGTECAQDMLFIKKLLESLELQVKLPMILHIDNKGFVDFTQNWNTGGGCAILIADIISYGNYEKKE